VNVVALDLPMALKDRVKQLRAAAGMSQQKLATRAGLSISGVTQIEVGTIPDPRLSTVKALARALGVSLDVLAEMEMGEGAGEPQAEPQARRPPAPAKGPKRRPRGRPRKED
jgi:transcriptional regulator with XRE-family HTH domain